MQIPSTRYVKRSTGSYLKNLTKKIFRKDGFAEATLLVMIFHKYHSRKFILKVSRLFFRLAKVSSFDALYLF